MGHPFYIIQDGKATPGTKKLFHSLTKATWTDKLILPHSPIEPSDYKTKLDEDLAPLLHPLYKKFLKNKPRLLLHPSYGGGFSIQSLEVIEVGSVVGEYLGEYKPNVKAPSQYRFGPIDAKEYRNTTAMIEDGFPNVQPFYLFETDDAPLKILFISLEKIEKNTDLLINYGLSHSVKIGHHVEYGFSKMCSFFKEHPLSNCFKRLQFLTNQNRSNLTLNENLELENLAAKLQYLYQTPSAMLLLLLSGEVTAQELFNYFNRLDCRFYLLGYSMTPKPRQIEITNQITLLISYFSKENRPDDIVLELSTTARIRLLVSFFLKNYLLSGNHLLYYNEVLLLTEADLAIQKGDKNHFSDLFAKSAKPDLFLEEAIFYAKEVNSPLYEWLRGLISPITPPASPPVLRPAA